VQEHRQQQRDENQEHQQALVHWPPPLPGRGR
jgi:hypothetical protein